MMDICEGIFYRALYAINTTVIVVHNINYIYSIIFVMEHH